jgi:hypothetical protein
MISGKTALGEERRCSKVGACRHHEKYLHKRRGLRFWADIDSILKPSPQLLLLNTCPSGYIAQASSSTAI